MRAALVLGLGLACVGCGSDPPMAPASAVVTPPGGPTVVFVPVPVPIPVPIPIPVPVPVPILVPVPVPGG